MSSLPHHSQCDEQKWAMMHQKIPNTGVSNELSGLTASKMQEIPYILIIEHLLYVHLWL